MMNMKNQLYKVIICLMWSVFGIFLLTIAVATTTFDSEYLLYDKLSMNQLEKVIGGHHCPWCTTRGGGDLSIVSYNCGGCNLWYQGVQYIACCNNNEEGSLYKGHSYTSPFFAIAHAISNPNYSGTPNCYYICSLAGTPCNSDIFVEDSGLCMKGDSFSIGTNTLCWDMNPNCTEH